MMGLTFIHGNWEFTVTSATARKVNGVNHKYSGVATVNIVNNVANVEAMHCDEFTVVDARSFKDFATQNLNLKDYEFRRYDNGVLKTKTGTLTHRL